MGLKQKLVGLVGIVAFAGSLVLGGLVFTDGSGSDAMAKKDNAQVAFIGAWPKKVEIEP